MPPYSSARPLDDRPRGWFIAPPFTSPRPLLLQVDFQGETHLVSGEVEVRGRRYAARCCGRRAADPQ